MKCLPIRDIISHGNFQSGKNGENTVSIRLSSLSNFVEIFGNNGEVMSGNLLFITVEAHSEAFGQDVQT